MPNGGPTPDCIHCKFFKETVERAWYCTKHEIHLAYPIRGFCSSYLDPEPDANGDWLDQELDRSKLKPNWMYVWVDWSREDDWEAKGIKSTFEHFPLVTLHKYNKWTREKFLDAIVKIADEKRNV